MIQNDCAIWFIHIKYRCNFRLMSIYRNMIGTMTNIMSLLKACRLCLLIRPDNIPILSYNKGNPKLAQLIWKYLSIQVEAADPYPKNICPECLEEIENFNSFAVEVDKVQKRIRTMVLSCTSTESSTIALQETLIEVPVQEFKSEQDPLDTKENVTTSDNKVTQLQVNRTYKKILPASNRRAGASAETQIYNPNHMKRFVVVSGNPVVQTQCNNSSLIIGANTCVQNKQNLNVQTHVQNPRQMMPSLLISGVQNGANKLNMQTHLQNPRQIMPSLLISSVQNMANKLNVQTQPQNATPVLLLAGNSSNQNNVNLQNQNKIMPCVIVGGSSSVQNQLNVNVQTQRQNQANQLLLVSNNSAHINNLKVQNHFQNVNKGTQFQVLGVNPKVQKRVFRLNVPTQLLNQTTQLSVVGSKPNVQNNTNLGNITKQAPVSVSDNFIVQDKKVNSENARISLEDGSKETDSAQDKKASRLSSGDGTREIEAARDKTSSNVLSELGSTETETNVREQTKQLQHENLECESDATDDGLYYYDSDPNEYPQEYTQHDLDMAAFYDFSCAFCTEKRKQFKKYELLQRHCLKKHNQLAVVKCCGKEMIGEFALSQHMKRHTECVKCPECGKQLSNKTTLKCHIIAAHRPKDERPYKCSYCSKTFASKSSLHRHEETHEEEAANVGFMCNICDKEFPNSASLYGHQLYIHQKRRIAMCHICAKTFPTTYALRQHLNRHDTEREYLKCNECGKMLKNRETLHSHMRLHKGKEYRCTECSRVCKTASALRAHSLCHSNNMPHQCHICKKLFKRKTGLEVHLVIHTGEQPFQCPHCPRTFASKSNYFTHKLRMHTKWKEGDNETAVVQVNEKGEKRYHCPHCTQTFSSKSNYETHKMRRHKKKVVECDSTNVTGDENTHEVEDKTLSDVAGGKDGENTNVQVDENASNIEKENETERGVKAQNTNVMKSDTIS